MKIAIDCRYMGKSGIGRVCQGILDNLNYNENEYYLLGDPDKLAPYAQAHIIEDLSSPFSVKGLFSFPKDLNKECDCVIIPNFIIPFGIKIPVYTIIHDLIFLDLPDITTNGVFDRIVKKYLLKRCVKKSVKIACVSGFTKSRCEHYYPKFKDKFYVNYIGLSKDVLNYEKKVAKKCNNIIYVGNVKPHKGLRTLIDAYKMLPEGSYKLKIIGEKDGFLTGMDSADLNYDGVEFTGKLSNDDLLDQITSASFLVQPSLYEGFGLPPLEALYLGTKPIISDIPVFREIYSGYDVSFFKVEDAKDLKNVILNSAVEPATRRQEITKLYNYSNFVCNFLDAMGLIKEGNAKNNWQ